MKKTLIILLVAAGLLSACGEKTKTSSQETDTIALQPCPEFSEDSAFVWIERQCAFGPRVTGSEAWRRCGDWLCGEFERHGCLVEEQRGEVKMWDGTPLNARNITARYNPEEKRRVLLCAHWDSRPWADNDEDEGNHHTPVPAANDGASGVAVMLEIARLLHETDSMLPCGVDFVCFDAEDAGTPYWAEDNGEGAKTWCLGSQMWSEKMKEQEEKPVYGILFDMVGGYGATFSMEEASVRYARPLVNRLWQIAGQIGYGHYFPKRDGGGVVDDHLYVNRAGIPCIDIIPYHEYGRSVFGHTWHTLEDTPENIDRKVLKAVGQSVVQLLYNEKRK
ncbi:MAG: M28 family peptidase [Bacteroidaceae bacterium]|nr:M28 family peptidase [Bacteroidaceae bacterium]